MIRFKRKELECLNDQQIFKLKVKASKVLSVVDRSVAKRLNLVSESSSLGCSSVKEFYFK